MPESFSMIPTRRNRVCTALLLVPFLLAVCAGSYSLSARAGAGPAAGTLSPVTVATPEDVPASAASAPLIQATDLVYQGAFRLPHGTIAGSSFDYGGSALAFNPARNSLYMVGHAWQQQVAEVTIPTPATGSLSNLPTARVLQPFADLSEGRMLSVGFNPVSDNPIVGGLLAYRGRLYESVYLYYDGLASQVRSHFVSGLDLSVLGDVTGPYRVGNPGMIPRESNAGFVDGYMGLIPSDWQAALGGPVLTGNCCIPLISRTSYGPAVFAIDPAQLGSINPLPAVPLVYYPSEHPTLANWGDTSRLFNGSTLVTGVMFPEGTRSVLFMGRQGIGRFCYGEGTSNSALDGTLVSGSTVDRYCYDPSDSSKGTHSYPYAYYVWAYDALDLAAVKSGQRQPWDVKPYAVWSLNIPFAVPYASIMGATYDPQTGRIFVSEAYGDGSFPLIHVFTVGQSTNSNTTIDTTTDTTRVVDDSNAVWTIGSGLAILRNGVQAGSGYGSKILLYRSTIYVLGTDSNWWRWTGSTWVFYGPNPPADVTVSVSPDGTTVPPASSIVDNSMAVWTIGSNLVTLRNGSQAAGGWGSPILWYQGVIYVRGGDSNWWRWTGAAWTIYGPNAPNAVTGSASPDGTRVPGASRIIDNSMAVWTIGPGFEILRNGSHAAGGQGSAILWYRGVIYVLGGDSNWWRWTGSSWSYYGSIPVS